MELNKEHNLIIITNKPLIIACYKGAYAVKMADVCLNNYMLTCPFCNEIFDIDKYWLASRYLFIANYE
jgi:hypothetical protein